MIDKFLKAKAWQIFFLTFGLPTIAQILLMVFMARAFISAGSPDIDKMMNIFMLFPIIMVISVTSFGIWFYALGVGLHRKLPDSVSMPIKTFKIFIIIPAIYIAIILVVLIFFMKQFSSDEFLPNNSSYFFLIFPIHIFSMFCIFYCLYFISKAIKAVELQRPVTFSDYIGEFFLIWMYPIGIWIIQPRINKLFDDTAYSDGTVLDEGIK